MPLDPTSVFCIASSDLAAWTQSTAADGQAAAETDVQRVLQQRTGTTCPEGQTRLHVNTGDTAAYLVAYDTRVPTTEEAGGYFGYGFMVVLALRPLGKAINEAIGIARKLLP